MSIASCCFHCHRVLQVLPGPSSVYCSFCNVRVFLNYQGPWTGIMPPVGLPRVGGRKMAVICGVSYSKIPEYELKGSFNDARCMQYMLVNLFGFPPSNIVMLTDYETDPYRIPTKRNIKMALNWLVKDCRPGDSLVFHFSGHGFQQRNYTGDEVDGYDETICPIDFQSEGMIVDNEINETIVRPLKPGVKLHAIIDSCHSGTVLDLPFLCRMDRDRDYHWEDHRPPNGAFKGTSGGKVMF